MKLLRSTRNEYLLDASIESLHAESVVWLSQLNFWNEEIMFFNNILAYKKNSDSQTVDDLVTMEEELVRFRAEVLTKTQTAVSAHEKLLDALHHESSADESNGRHTHRILINEMVSLNNEIRQLRKNIFERIGV
jgi:hypothetical protein